MISEREKKDFHKRQPKRQLVWVVIAAYVVFVLEIPYCL